MHIQARAVYLETSLIKLYDNILPVPRDALFVEMDYIWHVLLALMWAGKKNDDNVVSHSNEHLMKILMYLMR